MHRYLFLFTLLGAIIFTAPLIALEGDNLFQKGGEYLCKGDYKEAVKTLEKGVQKSQELGLLERLVLAYNLTGQYQKAKELIQKHITPTEPRLWMLLGELAMTRGEYKEAEEILQKAVKLNVDLIRAKVDLGLYYEQIGRRREAIQIFSQVFEGYNPDSKYSVEDLIFTGIACRNYAMKSSETDRTDTLKIVVQEILPKAAKEAGSDPFAFEAYVQMADMFLQAYNNADAKSTLEEGLKINPFHPELLRLMALVWMQRTNNGSEAMHCLERALSVNPNFVEALDLKAIVHLSDEEYDKAQESLDKALAVNANSLTTRSIQAAFFYLQNRMVAYSKECSKVLSINPSYGDLYLTIASLTTYKHQFEDGVELCKKAIELDPFLWDAYISLGTNLMRVGKEDEAQKSFEKVEEEYNFHTQTHNMLILLKKLKEFKVLETPHFRIRLHVKENDVMKSYIEDLLEAAYKKLTKQYEFEPSGSILTTLYPDHRDFAVNVIGIAGLGAALGVCFGKLTAQISPTARPVGSFNWGTVAWHEFTHCVTLQLSDFHVPRWFTEGLSMFSEYEEDPASDMKLDMMLYSAYTAGKMRGIKDFNAGFTRPKYPEEVAVCYYQGGLICRFLNEKYGFKKIIEMLKLYKEGKRDEAVLREALDLSTSDFDKSFLSWVQDNVFSKINVLPFITEETKDEMIDKLEEDSTNVDANLKLAIYYFQRRNFSDAETKAGMALSYDPKQKDAYSILGRILYTKGRHEKAKELLEKAISLGSKDFHTYLCLGFIYRDFYRDPDKAIENFKKAKESYPTYVAQHNPYQLLAEIYFGQKKDKEAEAELEDYLKQEGTDFKTRLDLSKRYASQKRDKDVIRILEEALLIDPFNLDVHMILGESYKTSKMWDKGIREYQVAIALNPKSGLHRIHTSLAELYIAKGDREKAREHLNKALEINPKYERAKKLLEEWK